ncbi:MAG: Holliday junction branch migration DNA helicase RuvB [Rickettsiales bacterium]|jgi:Holliday junction DNA helicase RuvB|nr:Holliday junction branch migration DNA helicase RuvB [Rickettsiales bacterium]
METERIMTAKRMDEDRESVRPLKLSGFVGQDGIKENLKVFIDSAVKRGRPLDHCLLYGPPGLGKTTLAGIIANEMGAGFRSTSAPMFTKVGDLAAIFTNLEQGDVLFIDEIHRLPAAVEEVLYSVMEDFKLDLIIGEGPAARTVKIDIVPFTLVGATTRTGLLSNPLRERFGIPLGLGFYSPADLAAIIRRSAEILGIRLDAGGADTIAARSRGTPRIANRLLRRVRDFAIAGGRELIDAGLADDSLARLSVDASGLDALDRRYLSLIVENYGGGPVGIETLSALLSEDAGTIEDVIEPYLLQTGLLQRTPRGRVITAKACRHLGLDGKFGKNEFGKKEGMLI